MVTTLTINKKMILEETQKVSGMDIAALGVGTLAAGHLGSTWVGNMAHDHEATNVENTIKELNAQRDSLSNEKIDVDVNFDELNNNEIAKQNREETMKEFPNATDSVELHNRHIRKFPDGPYAQKFNEYEKSVEDQTNIHNTKVDALEHKIQDFNSTASNDIREARSTGNLVGGIVGAGAMGTLGAYAYSPAPKKR